MKFILFIYLMYLGVRSDAGTIEVVDMNGLEKLRQEVLTQELRAHEFFSQYHNLGKVHSYENLCRAEIGNNSLPFNCLKLRHLFIEMKASELFLLSEESLTFLCQQAVKKITNIDNIRLSKEHLRHHTGCRQELSDQERKLLYHAHLL